MPSDKNSTFSGASPGPADSPGSFANYLHTNFESEIYRAAHDGAPSSTPEALKSGLKLSSLGISLLFVTFVVVIGLVIFRLTPGLTGPREPAGKVGPGHAASEVGAQLKVGSTDTVSRFKDSKEIFLPQGKSRMRPAPSFDRIGTAAID